MNKNRLVKSIFTIILLVIFSVTPLIASAKSGKSHETVSKNEVKAEKKGTKMTDGLNGKLNAIGISVNKITALIDAYLGVTTPTDLADTTTPPAGTTPAPEPSTTPAPQEPAADENVPAVTDETSGDSVDDVDEDESVEQADDEDEKSGDSADDVDEDETVEQADVDQEDNDGLISPIGFVSGSMGKLNSVYNRLQAVKRELAKVPAEAAAPLQDKVSKLETQIIDQYKRLVAILIDQLNKELTNTTNVSPKILIQ